jgi:hypothetical protein
VFLKEIAVEGVEEGLALAKCLFIQSGIVAGELCLIIVIKSDPRYQEINELTAFDSVFSDQSYEHN